MQRLSILIPAYREAATIHEVLRRVAEVDTRPQGFEKEIIVCDDGSPDATAEEIERAIRDFPAVSIVLVRHPENRGKGAAIRSALARATGEYVLIQDADLEYEVSDYPAILDAVNQGAEAVYGSRFLTRAYPEGMALPNFLANKVLTTTANVLYRSRITDEATCFKVMKTDLLRGLGLTCERFEFCPEVTAKLGLRKVKIVEVPISYSARDEKGGKKIRWTDGIEAFWVLVRHRLGRR
jgi:dolichol-phosphate mannosyltransferase